MEDSFRKWCNVSVKANIVLYNGWWENFSELLGGTWLVLRLGFDALLSFVSLRCSSSSWYEMANTVKCGICYCDLTPSIKFCGTGIRQCGHSLYMLFMRGWYVSLSILSLSSMTNILEQTLASKKESLDSLQRNLQLSHQLTWRSILVHFSFSVT